MPEPASYKFVEFPYTETRKNEALFREYIKACEQTPACWNLEDVEQTSCVRCGGPRNRILISWLTIEHSI